MQAYRTTESWQLRWGAIFGGAAIAITIGWIGELLGGLFALFNPGRTTVWAWLGALLNIVFWAGGAFVGGFVASRSAERRTRAGGMVYAVVVWGLMGVFGAFLFALLGGNVGLLAGGSAGAVRLSLGSGIVALAASFVGALLGGLAGQTEALRVMEERRPGGPSRRILRPEEEAAARQEPPEEPKPPPSIH